MLKGEDWFQDIPEDWASGSVKHLFDIQLGKMLQSERQSPSDRLVKYLKAQHVQWHCVTTTDLPEMWASPKELSQYSVQNGDLLVCEGGEAGRGAVVQGLEEEAIIQNALHRVRSNKNHARFLEYVLRSVHTSGWFDVLCNKSTIAHFTVEKFGAMRIPFPPLKTQKLIATFLDRKTEAIDTLITKKQRLIQLLEEKCKVLINQAITKGLNPKVPMKDSGIPWIGKIPENWDIRKIKFVCRLETGHTPSRTEKSYWVENECVIPWVSLNDTKTLAVSDYIDDTKHKISPLGMSNSSAHLIESGAVVFTRDATIGLAAIINKPMAVSQHIIAWVCLSDINNRFLLNAIYAMNGELERLTMGSTIKTIGMPDVKELRMPVPPLEEQVNIANQIDEEQYNLKEVISKIKSQIERLQEYRRSLITAAVTGKLNIKEVETNV